MRRIDRRLVLLSIVLVCDVVSVFGRPQEQNADTSQLKDDHVNRKDAVAMPVVVFPETSIDFGNARAHTTKSPPMGDSMKTVSDQLLQTSTSTNVIVSSEIRTVPKNDQNHLKGEAVPVLTDDDVHAVGPYTYKISSDGSTRPTGDLSTWILLGGESSPAPMNMATIKKVPKPVDTTVSSFVQSYETSTTRKRKPTTEKTTVAVPTTVTESPLKLQDSKFKNKTPVIVGKIPTTTTVKDKVEEPTSPLPELPPLDNNTRFGTPVVTFPHVPPRQRPSANNTKKVDKPLTTKVTSTAVVISKPLNNTTSVSSTALPTTVPTASSSTTAVTTQNSTEIAQNGTASNNTTVKNTSLKKKKKKKNKNKRRPIKTSNDDAQSKIDEQSTKITPGRPLSTRIYNYLAREVMPNVGVGLVGLMLTAGLAGLLLYSPIGGAAIPMVPLRRTDPQVHGHSHGQSSGYVPPETDNSQPEEQVFGQVLSGMNYGHNPYGRERPDVVPKYKPSSYQPSEYSAVHDVPKYNAHDTAKYSALDAAKYSAVDTAKYSGHDANNKYAAAETTKFSAHDANKYALIDATKYATHDGTKYAVVESTKYTGPDANKYAAPDASKYSTIDVSAAQDKVSYPSLETSQEPAFEQTQQDSQDQTYQNHHYDQLKFDSSNAFEQPGYQGAGSQVKSAYQEEDQSSAFDSPKYPGYVQDVPKEEVLPVNYGFENHRGSDEKESSTTSSGDPTYSALQGVPKFYNPSTSPEQISVNVHQTMKMEHGPRSLRIRRQVDEHNEIDAQLPEETTPKPAEETVKTTEGQTEDNVKFTTNTTTTTTTTPSEQPATVNGNQFSLVDLLKRVAEVKLRMGMEILRSTAASFTQYVNAIQRRMAHMVRSLQKSNDRQYPENKQEQNSASTADGAEKRQRRSLRQRIYTN